MNARTPEPPTSKLHWYSTLETKAVIALFVTALFIFAGGAAGVWGLDRIETVSQPILTDQIPRERVTEEMIAGVTTALLSAEQAIDIEDQAQIDVFNTEKARFEDAKTKVETLLSALTWGSESGEFYKSANGANVRAWLALGYYKKVFVAPPDKATSEQAIAATSYFKEFVDSVEQALTEREAYILLPTKQKTDALRQSSKASMGTARSFADLTSQRLASIVIHSNDDANERATKLTVEQSQSRAIVVSTSILAIIALIITGLIFIRKVILEPVRRLAETAQKIGRGELTDRVALQTGDEFEYLGKAFNTMAENLSSYTATLEAEVRDRTKELAEKVTTIDVQLAHMREINAELDRSGKLLIRRDLALTRANEGLRHIDEMKTDFVSVATHQLRTPLSGIRWTLSMLIKGDLGVLSPEQRTFLMKAYESNVRMITLLDDMLFSDKIESGKLEVMNESAFAPDLVDNIVLELQGAAAKKNVKINFVHPEGAAAPVRIATQYLRAILQNLLENAVKYSKPGGVVTVNISERDGSSEITVADDGIGIPADKQDRVFTRFFRAPNAVKMETDGSGLGLYIVKSIVDTHQGKIWFNSTENQGTKFHVILPLGITHT